jgi:hypothetical protein
MALDFLFKNDTQDEEDIKRIKGLEAEVKAQERERQEKSKRAKALLDSPVWKDVLSIIGGLKDKASLEARTYKSPEFLYGIDFLTELEKEIVALSNLY